MSTTFFNNSDLSGESVGVKSFSKKSLNSKSRSFTQLRFTEEESSDFRFSSFFGDDGSVFHNLKSFLEDQNRWSWETEDTRLDRSLELSETLTNLHSRGGEWSRLVEKHWATRTR